MQNGIESINYEQSVNFKESPAYYSGFHDALVKVLEAIHKREDDLGFKGKTSEDEITPYLYLREEVYRIYKECM